MFHIWNNTADTNIKPLQITQNQILKLILQFLKCFKWSVIGVSLLKNKSVF